MTTKTEKPKAQAPKATGKKAVGMKTVGVGLSGGRKGRATALSQKVADVLIGLRRSRQMSQRAFAEHIGVSFQQYQKYEKGRDRLSLERAIVLCQALGMPLGIFMRETATGQAQAVGFAETEQAAFGAAPASRQDGKNVLKKDEAALLEIFASIPEKSRRDFLETVRQLAKMTAVKS